MKKFKKGEKTMEEKRTCSNCGARLRQGARFCSACGAIIRNNTKPENVEPVLEVKPQEPVKPVRVPRQSDYRPVQQEVYYYEKPAKNSKEPKRVAPKQPKVEKETFDLLKLGVEYTKYTNGYFNIFSGGITDFWDKSFYYAENGDGSYDPYFNKDREIELANIVKCVPSVSQIDEVLIFILLGESARQAQISALWATDFDEIPSMHPERAEGVIFMFITYPFRCTLRFL